MYPEFFFAFDPLFSMVGPNLAHFALWENVLILFCALTSPSMLIFTARIFLIHQFYSTQSPVTHIRIPRLLLQRLFPSAFSCWHFFIPHILLQCLILSLLWLYATVLFLYSSNPIRRWVVSSWWRPKCLFCWRFSRESNRESRDHWPASNCCHLFII